MRFHIIQKMEHLIRTQTAAKKKVVTEDLGKIFEMAICKLYDTEYDGNYKYSLDEATALKDRISNLKSIFPHTIKHTARGGNKYDFCGAEDINIKLSAKTTKKDGKVCPQVIGQPSKKKFCEFFGLAGEEYDLPQIKRYIEENAAQLLDVYFENTFDCPVVYFNQHKNKLIFVRFKDRINWTNCNITFSHIMKNRQWNESTGLLVDNNTIGEFQVHNHRDCIKFRWAFEKLLDVFKDHFEMVEL